MIVFDFAAASNILVAGAPKQGKSTATGTIVDALKSCQDAPGMEFVTIDTSKPHWDAEETLGVQRVMPVPQDMLRAQIDSIFDDIRVDVVKIGMIPDLDSARVVTEALRGMGLPVVYDPVMISTSGHPLMREDCLEYVIGELFPLCTLVTPNLPETEAILARLGKSGNSCEGAGEFFVRHFCTAFLLKGGHAEGEIVRDILFDTQGQIHEFTSERIHTSNLHGTGCTLSSAIACGLAQGLGLPESVKRGKALVNKAITAAKNLSIGSGNGPLIVFSAD